MHSEISTSKWWKRFPCHKLWRMVYGITHREMSTTQWWITVQDHEILFELQKEKTKIHDLLDVSDYTDEKSAKNIGGKCYTSGTEPHLSQV